VSEAWGDDELSLDLEDEIEDDAGSDDDGWDDTDDDDEE